MQSDHRAISRIVQPAHAAHPVYGGAERQSGSRSEGRNIVLLGPWAIEGFGDLPGVPTLRGARARRMLTQFIALEV